MQTTTEEHLKQIEDKMAIGERKEPARLLEQLIRQMGPIQLEDWRVDIMKIVNRFQKRTRRKLTDLVSNTIEGTFHQNSREVEQPRAPYKVNTALQREFQEDLEELRESHIYQWSTFYRDCLDRHFVTFLDEIDDHSHREICEVISRELNTHSCAIFSQGYSYVRNQGQSHGDALDKSVNGLARFLELPLDFYSTRSYSVSDFRSAFALKSLMSAAVSGILKGYADAKFGEQLGNMILPRFQRRWVHYMGFLSPTDAECVIKSLEPGPLSSGLRASILPLVDALHKFFDRHNENYFPIPVVGQYSWSHRRLDIAVRSPRAAESQRLLEASAFLEDGFVSTSNLDDILGRQVMLIVAPLRPDIRRHVQEDRKLLAEIVVATDNKDRVLVSNEAFKILDDAIFSLRSRRTGSSPITYNFAREFPLHDPNKAKFFHVTRTSVRDLLKTFERHNGARLWCSVRRSGKTTACFDLGSTTGDSIIVSQTCGVAQSPGDDRFIKGVLDALRSDTTVADTFITDLIYNCSQVPAKNHRIVLVVDEYETLFGHLRLAEDDPRSRLQVVQPILNQLMAFSHDNLLVFLGQQPDAHFILMDQNQLAPYVQQDSFPLFEHVAGTTAGEFSELVSKVLAARIEYMATFLDALFEETAGHPFLTVNVLVEFVEWLIQKRRSQIGLRVDASDFLQFTAEKLNSDQIAMSPEYEFFRNAASSAMSARGYSLNNWLYAVYWVLQRLSNRGDYSIPRSRFSAMIRRIPTPKDGKLPAPSEILRAASRSNFLTYNDESVRIKIRILGRIAASIRPALH